MRLEGLHHVTMITGDARRCVDFHADVLGLRLVKKTVNFDAPDLYHLYFGDDSGSPGSILTWFEFPGAAPGRPGAGAIHTIELGVGSVESLAFWQQRLGSTAERDADGLSFSDPDGLRFRLVVADSANPPLRASHPSIGPEQAIVGVEGARAYPAGGSSAAEASDRLLTETLGFPADGRLEGASRRFRWAYDPAPVEPERVGAGSVHHIAWACRDADQRAWQERLRDAGAFVTEVRDRDYFRSIYFREPRGVLFEIATLSPGFAVDEDPSRLGEELRIPEMHAALRERIERTLTPIENPRGRLGA